MVDQKTQWACEVKQAIDFSLLRTQGILVKQLKWNVVFGGHNFHFQKEKAFQGPIGILIKCKSQAVGLYQNEKGDLTFCNKNPLKIVRLAGNIADIEYWQTLEYL